MKLRCPHEPQNINGQEQTRNSNKTSVEVISVQNETQGRNKAVYDGSEYTELQESPHVPQSPSDRKYRWPI